VVFQVQFKRGFNDFVLSPHVMEAVSVGDFVVTECFQGTGLGVVTEIITMEAFVEKRNSSVYRTQYDEEEDKRVYHILRLASAQEMAQLSLKHRDEQNVFQTALRLATDKYRLPMKISEVEFQFDRQKLTIFYTSDTRIDFREIVRELFSTFKTRIWMKKTNQSAPFLPKRFASLSLTTGVQFSQTDSPVPV
jgi:cell fate regulator YaaT (PSP1 superfamily)